jgi:hypothetical protein
MSFSKDSIRDNIWLTIIWAFLGLVMLFVPCAWGILQGVIWHPTVNSFKDCDGAKKETRARQDLHEMQGGVLTSKDLEDA